MAIETKFGTFEEFQDVAYTLAPGGPRFPAVATPLGVETCGVRRVELEAGGYETLYPWAVLHNVVAVEVATSDHALSHQELQAILEGRGFYGYVQMDVRRPAPGVLWYGNPGTSASVGPWVRNTWGLHMDGKPIHGLHRWWMAEEEDGTHRMWHFGIEIDRELHLVGGCTDFSGEGGHARRLAEAYLNYFPMEVATHPGSQLVDVLVEGWHR